MENCLNYAPVECINVPKILFQDKKYVRLSTDAKLLYSLLLDRKSIAYCNGWLDSEGTPYVIYTRNEMKKHMNASRHRIDAALDELTECNGMICITYPSPGKACQIYVNDITEYHKELEDEDLSRDANELKHSGEFSELMAFARGSINDDEDKAAYKKRYTQELEEKGFLIDGGLDYDAVIESAVQYGNEIAFQLYEMYSENTKPLVSMLCYIDCLYDEKKFKRMKHLLEIITVITDGLEDYFYDMDSLKENALNLYVMVVFCSMIDLLCVLKEQELAEQL